MKGAVYIDRPQLTVSFANSGQETVYTMYLHEAYRIEHRISSPNNTRSFEEAIFARHLCQTTM
jgi:hypothetical protein